MKKVHKTKWFSSQILLLCRDYRPAYKSYKTVSPYLRDSEQMKKENDTVTCKSCLKIMAKYPKSTGL